MNQCWIIVNWTVENKFQWNLTGNSYIFIQENGIENVAGEIAAILSMGDKLNSGRWLLYTEFNDNYRRRNILIILDILIHNKMADILEATFSNTFSSMLSFVFGFEFH